MTQWNDYLWVLPLLDKDEDYVTLDLRRFC